MRPQAGAVLALLLVAACASDGTELREPPPTTAPTAVQDTGQPDAGFEGNRVEDLVFDSPAIEGRIPVEHTCEGADRSPPLTWSGVPVGAVELALTVTDPDADGFVHWAVAGLPPEPAELGAGTLPEGAVAATNDAGEAGWSGPCPPEEHRYVFTLHVLPEPLDLPPGLEGRQAVRAIERSSIRSVSFAATFAPGG